MTTFHNSFFTLTAADLMSQPVHVVSASMPLREAARLFSRAQISGAPVVDGSGCCVGVLSATDFVHWAEKDRQAEIMRRANEGEAWSDWQMMELDSLPKDEVRRYMTADPVTVEPGTRVAVLAQIMLDAHIHRVIVVGENHQPIGVVSVTDLLAAVARAANLVALESSNKRGSEEKVGALPGCGCH